MNKDEIIDNNVEDEFMQSDRKIDKKSKTFLSISFLFPIKNGREQLRV